MHIKNIQMHVQNELTCYKITSCRSKLNHALLSHMCICPQNQMITRIIAYVTCTKHNLVHHQLPYSLLICGLTKYIHYPKMDVIFSKFHAFTHKSNA